MAGKGPHNNRDAEGRNTLGFRDRSPRTGKPFKTNPNTPRKCRRDKITDAIEDCINSPFMDIWVTANEIAYIANRSIPATWSQITPNVVGQIMRKYIASGHVERDRFKTLDPFSYRRIKYIGR